MTIVFHLLIVLLVAAGSASAQIRLPKDSLDWPTPHNVVLVNPGGIAVDYLSAAYVTRVADRHGVGVFGTLHYRPVGAYLPRGIGGGLLYRYYPAAQALWRFHYGGQISYLNAWLTGDPESATGGIGLGASVGWQWFPVRRFAVGLSVGEQYIAPLGTIENDALAQVFGFRPVLSFDVGLAW